MTRQIEKFDWNRYNQIPEEYLIEKVIDYIKNSPKLPKLVSEKLTEYFRKNKINETIGVYIENIDKIYEIPKEIISKSIFHHNILNRIPITINEKTKKVILYEEEYEYLFARYFEDVTEIDFEYITDLNE